MADQIDNRQFSKCGRYQHFSISIFSILFLLTFPAYIQCETPSNLNTFFIDKILQTYGAQNSMDVSQLQSLLDGIFTTNEEVDHLGNDTFLVLCLKNSLSTPRALNLTDVNTKTCLLSKCLTARDLYQIYGLTLTSRISASELLTFTPALVYQAQLNVCKMNATEQVPHRSPSPAEVWGYGFLFVTIINLSSLVGVAIIPLMKKKFYELLLMSLVSLAVGVLCGSALLFLIPDALGLAEIPEVKNTYVWKAMAVVGGIYMFFLVERFLKIFIHIREKRRDESKRQEYMVTPKTINSIDYGDSRLETATTPNGESQVMIRNDSSASCGDSTNTDHQQLLKKNGNPRIDPSNGGNTLATPADDKIDFGHSHSVAPVAWMIIFGDGVHNFIDGLAIGAAFSENVLAGISISLAVLCEEFPHELGDFAILLKSGLSVKKAVLFNFLSACSCYIGLCLGIVLGELASASQWIFAIAGGMFLYISLVDMMPEINAAADDENIVNQIGKKTAFIIQNIGLVLGFALMLILAVYGGQIDLTSG